MKPELLAWTWFTSKQINLPLGVLKIGTLTGRRWSVVHADGNSRDFRQFDDSGYGDQMVTATEHLEDGTTVSLTGLDPDLQAVTRAARLFAEQMLARRRGEFDLAGATVRKQSKRPIRSVHGKVERARSRYR